MAELRQRVFLIFVRPSFVKPGPAEGYPNTIMPYLGEIYRAPLGAEVRPSVTLPDGYSACIKLPALNAPIVTTGAEAVIGGGVERFDNIYRAERMPDNRPDDSVIETARENLEDKRALWNTAQQNLTNNPENASLIEAEKTAKENFNEAAKTLETMINGAVNYSIPPFNENNFFSNDTWQLHSTWTSFDKVKIVVRPLIDQLGFEGVMVANWIPLDMQLLPNK